MSAARRCQPFGLGEKTRRDLGRADIINTTKTHSAHFGAERRGVEIALDALTHRSHPVCKRLMSHAAGGRDRSRGIDIVEHHLGTAFQLGDETERRKDR